jgi:hypothetical protein
MLTRAASGGQRPIGMPPAARFADSWILANRTARPNLGALTVAFDRAS